MELGKIAVDVMITEKTIKEQMDNVVAKLGKLNQLKIYIPVDHSSLTDLNKHIDKKIKHIQELNRQTIAPHWDDGEILRGLNDVKRQLQATQLQLKLDTSDISRQIQSALSQQSFKIDLDSKGRPTHSDFGGTKAEFKALLHSSNQIKQAIDAQKPSIGSQLLSGVFQALGQNLVKEISAGVKSIYGKDAGNFVKKSTANIAKFTKTSIAENPELQEGFQEIQGIVDRRLKDTSYKLGDAIVAALEARDESIVGKINAATKAMAQGSNPEKFLTDIKDDAQQAKEALKKGIFSQSFFTNLAQPVGTNISAYRNQALQDRAIPLVRQRALDIIQDPKGNSSLSAAKAVNENTETLYIAIGGYAGAKGLSGKTLVSGYNRNAPGLNELKADPKNAVIWAKNEDSDLPRDAMSDGGKKLVALLTSLGKPNLRGYSKDAVEIAAQALAGREKNPNIQIKILGESGGGFAAEEAHKILSLIGIPSKYIGVGTPDFIGGLDNTGKNKILSPDEHLGAETAGRYQKIGLARKSASQNILGVKGHPYENYRNAQTAELMNFLHGSPGEMTPELMGNFKTVAAHFSKLDTKDMGRAQLEKTADGAYQNLQLIKRYFLEATGQTKEELQTLVNEFEAIYTRLTPESRDMETARRSIAKAAEYLTYLQKQPGVEASIVAQNIAKELDQVKRELQPQLSRSVGTQQRKLADLMNELVKVQKGLFDPAISIKKSTVNPFTSKESEKVSEVIPDVVNSVENLVKAPVDIQAKIAEIKRIAGSYSELYQKIKEDILTKNFAGSNRPGDIGAIARTKAFLSETTRGKARIEELREEAGVAKIGTSEASQINQAKGQITSLEKLINRGFAKNKIPLPEVSPNVVPDGVPLQMGQVGRDAAKGFARGVESEQSPVEAIQQKMEEVIEVAKKALDERSPSKIFQTIGQYVVQGFNIGLNAVGIQANAFVGFIQKVKQTAIDATESIKEIFSHKINSGILNYAKNLIPIVASFVAIKTFLPQVKDFLITSLSVATEMENIKRQVVYGSPNVSSGRAAYDELSKNAEEMRLDKRSVLRAGGQFLAGSQGTNLEGQQAIDILKNFNSLQAARGLDKQQQDSFNLAIAQIVGKGGLQAQELKLQAGQALPGFVQIYARSQGLTPEQLNKKLQTTPGGLSTDTLLTASQQAKAESALGLGEALKSSQAELTRFDNNVLKVQERLGNLFLPLQKAGLSTLSQLIEGVIKDFNQLLVQVGYIALVFAKPFLEPVKQGLRDLSKSFLDSVGSGKAFSSVMGFLKTTAVEMGTLLVVTKLIEGLVYTFSDASKGIKDFADASEKSLEKLRSTINSTGEDVKKLSKQFDIFASREDKFKDMSRRLEAFKIASDTAGGLSKLNTTSTGILDTTNSDKFNANIANTQRIDKELEIIQARKRAFVIDSPEDSQGLKRIQDQEKSLIDERYKNVAGISQAQFIIETQIKSLKEAKKQLEDNDIYGQYTEDIQKAAENIDKLTKKQVELTKAIGQTTTAFDRWKMSVQELTIVRDDDRVKLEKYVNASKAVINNLDLSNSLTQGQKGLRTSSIDIKNIESQLKIQKDLVALQKESFSSNSTVQATIKAQGINENTPIGKIRQKIELSSNENDKFILQQFEAYQQAKVEVSSLEFQVTEARANLLQNLRNQTKSVLDFYTSTTRQAEQAQLEILKVSKDVSNEMKYKALASKIRQTMLGLEDGFFTQFVEAIASQLDQLGQLKTQSVDQQVAGINSKFKQEDLIKQAVELSRTLPGEAIKIPVDVDLSSPEALQQITSGLNKNFEDTTSLTAIIDSNIKATNDKLSEVNKKSDDFKSKLLDAKEATNSIAQGFQAVKESIESAISGGFNLYQMFTEAGKAAGNIAGVVAQVAANPVQAVKEVTQQATEFLGGVGKVDPFKIIDSNKGFNVTSYEQLTRHHANRGNERPHLYKTVEGKQEETNGGSLVKKDFVLVGKGGRQDVGVPSPISGYVRTSSNFGTVEIYKDPAFKELMGRILHLSDFAVKTGDQVNRGQNLGTQGGRGVGGRQGAYGVHFHGEFTPDVWKPYIKSLISGDFGSISNAFKGTGLDKAWNNLLGNKPKVENSSVTSYKDSVSNTANTKDDAGLTKLGQKYASLLNDPRVTAFLRSIAIAEVGSNLVGKGQGYGKLAGGDYSKEEIADPSKITNIPGGRYKPFGRYQINNVDVEYAKKELGIQNLSPRNQDIIGVQRLAMRGAIEPLLAGNIDQAMRLAGKEFASLEGSPWIGKHGNKVTAGGSRSAFMQNYQHGLSQKNLVTSYNSSDGRKDTVENSSVTSYKIQPQESAFIQNYRRNLGNQVLGTSLRGETLTPEQMQSTVREGLKAGLSAERGTLSVQQKKSDLEIKIAQDKIAQEALRILNQQRENRRQEGEKIKDTQLDTLNREFGAKGTPTIREVNQNKLEGIFREFDKTISQRTRELKLTNDAITQGERFIQTPGVTEAQKAETQKGLEVLRQSKAVTEDSITRLTKARETAISENARLFKNQVSQRDFIQQNELLQNTVTGLQTKISSLKILQALKPLDPRVQEIPDLEKAVALRQVTLDANKQINDIQQKVFTKEIENPQIAADMIANAKELARLKQKDIELTYEQAKANQLAANIALQLQRQQIFLDSQTGLNKEKSALIQFASRNSATSKDLTAQMKLEEENLTSKLNYDKLKETLRQQAAQGLISDGEYKGLRVTGAISNNLKMKNSRNDYEQSLMDTKQKYTQYLGQSESDVLNARASQENRRLGGNQFVANEYQRKAATLQENIKYAKELQQIEQDISNQKALGIDVTGLEAVKTNMQEIHSLNLEGINAQFKTFGETINSVAADSLKSLSQGLTDVILKGGSIGDVFQNMAQTILSSIINSGLSNLLGSLFGGGRPAKTGGVIMDILGGGGGESSPFGFIGSLFGGILGFAGGGDISYANMGDLRKGNHPIAKALSKEGSNSVLAALTPGERVLTVQENRKFKQLLGNNYQVLNFKTGGEVGMLNVASDNVAKYAKSGNQAINIDASIEENNKTPDERSLAKAIRTVVIAELARQKEVRR